MEQFYWCLHCERVYPVQDWIDNRWHCPRPGCDGWGEGRDALEWSWLRSKQRDYPKVPREVGAVYPLYGARGDAER